MSKNFANVIKLVSLTAVLALFLNSSFVFADDKRINSNFFGEIVQFLNERNNNGDTHVDTEEQEEPEEQEESEEQESQEEPEEQENHTESEADENENESNNDDNDDNEDGGGNFEFDQTEQDQFVAFIQSVVPANSSALRILQGRDEDRDQDIEEDVEENIDTADEQDTEGEVVASAEDIRNFVEKRKEDKVRIREDGYKIFKRSEKRKKKTQTTLKKLQEVSDTLSKIEKEKQVVQSNIQDAFDEEVEKIFDAASTQLALSDNATEVKDFDKEDRKQVLEKLRNRIQEGKGSFKQELEEDLYDTLSVDSSAADTADAVGKVLKSSLEEIALLVEEESGVVVDFSAGSRITRATVAKTTARLSRQKENFNSRGGLALYQDTDEDGISDYDEEFIYFTNPRDAFTAGSLLTDGERVLLGFDVTSTSTERVAVESPRTTGEIVPGLFRVNSIVVEKILREVVQEETSDAKTQEPQFEEVQTVVFSGSALPNSFITLYIFSNPVIVTVKTDANGDWTYTLDKELENGDHEIYVASVSNAGKIIAKSNLIPFVKTAEAVDFAPIAPEVFEDASIVDLKEYVLWGIGMFTAILIFVALATTGVWRNRRPDEFA